MKNFAMRLLISTLGILLGGGTAAAATTGIEPGPETPLAAPGGILDQLYGLDNLRRIDDDVDQIWSPASGSATAVAKLADFTQDVGYIPDLNGNGFSDDSFVPLFSVPGSTDGIGLGGPSGNLNSGEAVFVWALNPSGAPQWTSRPSENSDGLDHMVTWEIIGGAGNNIGNWVIAWEDLAGGGDRDFNDIVVEANVAPVPVPAAVWLFGSGLLGVIGIARRKVE